MSVPIKPTFSDILRAEIEPVRVSKLTILRTSQNPISATMLKKQKFGKKIAVNPRRNKPKKVTRRHKGGGAIVYIPSTFDKIHPIDLIFGTYNELSMYFQLIETTWCLIGFHGNDSHINDVTDKRLPSWIFKFSDFFIFELNTENGKKATFSDGRLQDCKVHCKVISIWLSGFF